MFENIKSRFDKKNLPTMELGSMCYMMSRDQYLSDSIGHWHPHLMFSFRKLRIWLGEPGCRALPFSWVRTLMII
jgi:hypothetical protein